MKTLAVANTSVYKGQGLALCWLVQQPLGAGGDILAGLTRTLAFSRAMTGVEWSALPASDRDRESLGFHKRVLRLFRRGHTIHCSEIARISPGRRGFKVERLKDAEAQDQGLLRLLEAKGDRLRRCQLCGNWFWRDRKREYCPPCFQSGTARSKVHRAKLRAGQASAGARRTRPMNRENRPPEAES